MPGVDFDTNIILNTNTLSSITSMDFDSSANNYMQLCNTNVPNTYAKEYERIAHMLRIKWRQLIGWTDAVLSRWGQKDEPGFRSTGHI